MNAVVLINKTKRARKFAERNGLAVELLSALPGENRIAFTIRPIPGGFGLAVRFFGFRKAKENGWTAAAATDRATLERIAHEMMRRCGASEPQPLGGRN